MDNNNIDNATLKDGFAGERRYLKGFLAKINLVFMVHPERFPNDDTKIAYLISGLFGDAMNWAATIIENNDPCLADYNFVQKLKDFFGDNDSTFIANQKHHSIRQRNIGGIRGYILEFNKYANESNWNEQEKIDSFLAGLNDQIADKILEMFPLPNTLSNIQAVAARIDSRLITHRNFSSRNKA